MEPNQQLVSSILSIFYTHGIKWRVGGELRAPTVDDITKVLDRLSATVYDGEENMQASTGGLLVKREYDQTGVYIHLGEYTHDDSN